VMNIVTKSGTNQPLGSFFEFFRDTKMNAETETERLTDVANAAAGRAELGKGAYRRNQFGGSFGGPIAQNKAHFFAAVERTQQDTFQSVTTKGLFPSSDGSFPLPYRENLVTVKETTNLNAAQYLGPLRLQPEFTAVRHHSQLTTGRLGGKREQVPLVQPESQLGHQRRQAERVHLPVRKLRQRDYRQQSRSAPIVPE